MSVSVNVLKVSDFTSGVRIAAAVAPEQPALDTPGKDVGDIRLLNGKAIVSLGKKEKVNAEMIRRAGGAIAKWLAKNNLSTAGIELASFDISGLPVKEIAFALTEGMLLGAFTFAAYKSDKKDNTAAVSLLLAADQAPVEVESAVAQAQIIAEATNRAREWSHEPPNVINPVTLAERAQALAAAVGLKCTIIDDQQLEAMGAGAIHAVGKASATPSRLIVLEYGGKKPGQPVVLVGKAITFDTGGYSLKTTDGIVGMKYDKSGGMAVISTLAAAAQLGLDTPVVGIIAASENMIAGNGYRPNDILKTLSGKTVEIISTDAEGRLVLADALTYAQQTFTPRAMIDIATLTGAVVVALGSVRAGFMSTSDELAAALSAAGERTYERVWRLPLDEEYFEQIKGDDSDIKNSGGRKAGSVIGGMFLKQFVKDEVAWAHVDIAGVMEAEKEMPYCPKGGMGFGVRLFIDYLQAL